MNKRNKNKAKKAIQHQYADYENVLSSVVELLDAARRASARVVNSLMTATYWEIGRRIVEHEQAGKARAEYGKELIQQLSRELTKRFGRGFGVVQVSLMRQFFATFSSREIFQSVTEKSGDGKTGRGHGSIFQSVIEKSSEENLAVAPDNQSAIGPFSQHSSAKFSRAVEHLSQIARAFPLPWTHYVRSLRIKNSHARAFYLREALAGGWSVRQLDRQINSQFYERTALSRKKRAMLLKGEKPKPEDAVSANEENP